ncbi:hypothetical protein [Sphingosinicella sp.]|uniref:hypothetical protein n=1 Tax=Sphingosinicella sp. TaxID=1917971 RepID=UPI0018192778|nr:hypothetical protein [Sphingosinicella sp.]MBA4757402.1 hypothetical protein [Sphingosinicella sp.]
MAISVCGAAIDWAATGTMLQGWGTLIGAVAVFAAAWIGANTFNSWKRQKITERHIEQAERILTAVYKARRALSRVRSPLMSAHELSVAEDQLSGHENWKYNTADKQRRLCVAKGYYNRIASTEAERTLLDGCLPMSRALFGEEVEKAIETVVQQFWAVKAYADAYIDDNGNDVAFSRQISMALYELSSTPDKGDEITDAIHAAIKTVEGVCLPVLRLEEPSAK